jgi:hypothetical protein
MPLIKGKSQKSFEHNVKTEMHHGKPQGQALAIAYSMKRKAQHKAQGGEVRENRSVEAGGGGGSFSRGVHETGFNSRGQNTEGKSFAGNRVREAHQYGDDMASSRESAMSDAKVLHQQKLNELKEMRPKSESGAYANGGEIEHEEHIPEHEDEMHYGEPESIRESAHHEQSIKHAHGGDIVSRIMAKKYSKGGVVSNEGDAIPSHQADQHAREYDYLVEEGGPESTQHDMGDHLGDAREDHDRHDIVSKIMHSLAKKDKFPKGYPGR